MPTLEIDGYGEVEVDDSFVKLSPADQQKTVDEITATLSKQNATPPAKDTSYGGALSYGIDAPLEGIGTTLQMLGAKDTGTALRAATDAPKNYQPASPEFINSLKAGEYGKAAGLFPRSVVEQGGQLGGSLLSRMGGAAAGGAIGSVIPGAGTAAGAALGAFAGPAGWEALQVLGSTAMERAQNNGRTEPNDEDWIAALGTAGVSGALNAIGIKGVGGNILGKGVKEAAKNAAKQTGKGLLSEGATETGQSVVEQVGSTAGTKKGLTVDPYQAVGEGLIGAGAGGSLNAVASTPKVAIEARRALEVEPNEAKTRLADRIDHEAKGVHANLKDVNRESDKGAEVVLSNVHTNLAEEIKDKVRVLKKELDPARAETLEGRVQRVVAQGSLRDARNKVKNVVSDHDFTAVEELVGDTQEGQQLITLMRESNELTSLYRKGLRGGVSQYTDELNPFQGASRYLPNGGLGALRAAGTVGGYLYNPLIPAAQGAGFFGGRAIDAITGRRSRANRLVKQYGGKFLGPDKADGLPSLFSEKLEDRARFKELAEQQIEENDPGIGGFFHYIHQNTGLLPQEALRGVELLKQQGRVTEKEATRFRENPNILQEGNVGNLILNKLAQLVKSGTLAVDPEFSSAQPSTTVATPQPNSFALEAYKAAAQGNQSRYNATKAEIENSNLPPVTKELIAKAAAEVSKANNRQDAEAVLKEVGRKLPPAAKLYALQKLGPLVELKRHATASSASQGRGATQQPNPPRHNRAVDRFDEDDQSPRDTLFGTQLPPSERRFKDGVDRVSTRLPTAKAALENPLTSNLVVGREAMEGDQKAFKKNTDILSGYPNYKMSDHGLDAAETADKFVEHVVDNLLWLHDQVPAEVRERSKLWYDGATQIAERWSDRFDLPKRAVAGVLAVLSPQKDWFQNVSLGERVLDVMTKKQDHQWDESMDETAARIFGKPQYADDVDAIKGTTLRQLTNPVHKAMWVRTYDEAHNARSYRLVTPEGGFEDLVRVASGNPRKAAWGSSVEIAKAIRIIENSSRENISDQLGVKHKVRNFYNNILEPTSAEGDVTIDTHAVAAGLLRALSGNSLEVDHNFGSTSKAGRVGAANSSITGMQGTYGLYADAYRKAAEQRGILPREMQSITWEAVRGLFPAKFKQQAKNVEAVDAIWNEYRKGEVSLDEARDQINALVGGITNPDWVGPTGGSPSSEGDTSYTSDIH